MRIASVVCVYPPYRGGIGQAAQRQAAILGGLGHRVEVFCPATDGGGGTDEMLDGVPVHRLRPLWAYGNSALLPQMATRLRGFDGVFLHYPFFGAAEATAIAARALRIPYVAYFHMDVFGEGARGAFLAAYRRTAGPLVLRGARAVMASSADYFAHSSAARHIPRVEVAPYGIDVHRYSPAEVSAEERARLGLPPGLPLLLFVGGMDAPHGFKGVPELLRAVARADLAGRASVSLVGSGELRPSYEALAAELGLGDTVRFHGRVSEEDLIALNRAADVAVLPSTGAEEAFGLVLIEGMACGAAAVASALPGVRDVVGEGVDAGGLLVPPGDVPALAAALRGLVDDPARRAALAERAVARVRARFSEAAERERLGEIVDRALSRGGRDASR